MSAVLWNSSSNYDWSFEQNGSIQINVTSLRDQRHWTMIGLSIIPLWILGGNLLVLISVYRNRSLRTLSNCVIASLAVTDLLLAIVVVPLSVYQLVTGSWELGLIVCLVWTGSDVFLSTTSILHLCAIAIHRYHGITNPLRVRSVLDRKYVATLLIPTWTISFAISIPLVVQGAMDTHHVLIGDDVIGHSCGIFHQTFAIYSSLVSFFIPLAIMVFADFRSIQILRKHLKFPLRQEDGVALAHNSRNERIRYAPVYGQVPTYDGESLENATSTATDVTSGPPRAIIEYRSRTRYNKNPEEDDPNRNNPERGSKRTQHAIRPSRDHPRGRPRSRSMVYISMLASRGAIKINSRERRAERTLIWVFVSFVVLWLPFFSTNLTYGLCQSCDIPGEVFLVFTWLGYLSSGVNPCIYTLLNTDFRNAFLNILTCNRRTDTANRQANCA
ncbi:hypothetical protein LSH36_999g00059 [Paralvinella palmiformis]|uniref:G-protein coupled receptors family 1 profile domain-containing protein n=1 Tax=Paralvinella palmiformis TaxID=53620 RepID=A0AAD9MSD2_9ANNE|nr:hypothetical protein LSH36_999g00059 [Paralvinella palmiformis]